MNGKMILPDYEATKGLMVVLHKLLRFDFKVDMRMDDYYVRISVRKV